MSESNVIFVNDLFREENMKKQHNLPIGALVRYTNPDEEYEREPSTLAESFENGMTLFVHKQSRDCDGTPLYSLSTIDLKGQDHIKYIIDNIIDRETAKQLSNVDLGMLIMKIEKTIFLNGYPESCLKLAF